jgi:dolichyl-phosphate-mannose--protein O-mannosyl transferase
MKKRDYIALGIIMLLYTAIALFHLGNTKAPESFFEVTNRYEQLVIDLGESTYLSSMDYYLGSYENRKITLETALEKTGPYTLLEEETTLEKVFSWGSVVIDREARFIRIIFQDEKASVGELVFVDSNGEVVRPQKVSSTEAFRLFDEENLYEGRKTYLNSTYFDEIYHARTAYEYIHGLYSYENTHPPFGKLLISVGIRIFGMNPFGWRIMGTLFGIFMLPLMYLFAKKICKKYFLTVCTTLLFAFDFMHFAQTRIATIDVFVTFFIILMYYFMYCYCERSLALESLQRTLIPLGLSGISMGFGVASKWTGAYAGVGLAVIFFVTLYLRWKKEKSLGYVWKTLAFCLVFFVLIPAVIYTLSYLPFIDNQNTGLIAKMLKNQETMFNYHTGIEATHPYSSWWYQWPIMYRPIWYYSGTASETVKEGISAFGNPLVWWVGIPAFFYMVYLTLRKKDKTAGFLAVGYLAQYLPWIGVKRITFIYHYFPSVPFVVLMIGLSMYRLWKKQPKLKPYIIGYTGAAVFLFLMFYPVLSGYPIPTWYADRFLRWFGSWVLL